MAIDWGGYQGGYWLIAGLILCIGFPAVLILVRAPQPSQLPTATTYSNPDAADEGVANENAGEDRHKIGMTFKEAARTKELYLIFIAIALASMALLGTIQQAVPMLADRGVSIGTATTIMSLVFIGVIVGEFSAGLIVDRLNSPKVVIPYFAYLISRYFGLKSFGTIYGLTLGASNLGIGIGIVLMGYARDTWGSYGPMGTVFLCAMSISLLCMLLLGQFRFAPPRR
jgi:predicted MFS family arabinose efflux permease